MRKKVLILIAIVGMVFMATAYPVIASDDGIPGNIELGSLQDRYGVVQFDHGMHIAYFTAGCGDCHHQHGGYESQPCGGCHALSEEDFKGAVVQSFMACGVCHGEYDPSNPGMPGLKVAYHKQCFKCHRGMGNVGKSPEGCNEKCHTVKEELQTNVNHFHRGGVQWLKSP